MNSGLQSRRMQLNQYKAIGKEYRKRPHVVETIKRMSPAGATLIPSRTLLEAAILSHALLRATTGWTLQDRMQ